MDPNLVILAGGISSRMKKPAESSAVVEPALLQDARQKSKSMIGLGPDGRPFLDFLLWNVREAGYQDVVIVVGEKDHDVRKYYGKSDRGNGFHGLTISYVVQPIPDGRSKPLGTADALLRALRARSDWKLQKFTVCNSDNLYSKRALRLLLQTTHKGAVIDYDRRALRFQQSRIEQFGIIRKSSDGYLAEIIEKPNPQQLAGACDATGRVGVSMNIFRLSYDLIFPVLEEVPVHPARQEKELPQAITMLAARDPTAIVTIPLSEYVPDLTYQDDIVEVQSYLGREYPNFSFD